MSCALLNGTWLSWGRDILFSGLIPVLHTSDEPCTVNKAGISSQCLVSCPPLESSWVWGNYTEKSGNPLSAGGQPEALPFVADHVLPGTPVCFTDKVPMIPVELARSIS